MSAPRPPGGKCCRAPLRRLFALAVLTSAVAGGCERPETSAPPITGCEKIGGGTFRCEQIVRAAAAKLPVVHPQVVGVVVLPRNDRQDALSGTRFVLANVEFAFADGRRHRVEVACLPASRDLLCDAP